MGVVVVADLQPVRGGLLGSGVEGVRGALDICPGGPLVGGDERVDDQLDPQGGGRLEGLRRSGDLQQVVGGIDGVGEDEGMSGGCAQPVPLERRLERVDPTDEVEGLDIPEADFGQPAERTVEVSVEFVVDRVQLHGNLGDGHEYLPLSERTECGVRARACVA